MAMTIRAPVRSRGDSRLRRALLYLIGSTVGGLALAALATLVGRIVAWLGAESVLGMLLALVALAAAAVPASNVWPQWRQQIPRWWVQPVTAAGIVLAGLVLGAGIFTYVTYPLFYVMVAIIAVLGKDAPLAAIAVGGVYGIANGAMASLQSGAAVEQLSTARARALIVGRWLARATAMLAVLCGIAVVVVGGIG